MCGINGFSWPDERLIVRMNEAIKHRGPDDEGYHLFNDLSLGHVRLSILDLSHAGHQPMFYLKEIGASSEKYHPENIENSQVVIVFNGEIYNFRELREELRERGYKFTTNTDTEVILAAYLEWEENCVHRFNGMWAFAIYDKARDVIFLSRDRFGIKPLYYYYDGKNIIFSSEIRAILEHSIERKPNDAIIFDFLYYNLLDHTEETFFEGIKRVMPGYNVIFDLKTRKIKMWQYYNLADTVEAKKEHANPQKFRELFLRAVKRRLVADVPVGSCLSGGLDSSSIVCTMRQIEPNANIKTFSLIFPGLEIDESQYQNAVVGKCHVEWYKTTFTARDVLRDLEEIIQIQEEPFYTLSIYGQYQVMKLAKKHGMKVLLDGQGSDEILAGYHYFFGYYYYELFRHLKLRRLIKEIKSYRKNTGSFKAVKYFLGLLLPERLQRWILNRNTYLSMEFIKEFKHRKDPRFQRKELNEALVSAVVNNLPQLLRFEDKNAMRWSIETRVPFLDPELVEYILSTPPDTKIKNGITKVILREALQGLVPDTVLKRKDKIGFITPDKEIANSPEVRAFIWSVINSESFKSRRYWNWKKIHKVYLNSERRKGIFIGEDIWKVVILELWLRKWIEGGSIGEVQ